MLDIGLPDASGLEVLTEVKQSAPHIQVIVLTGQDSLSNAIESIKLGAFHFISKPYAPEELLSLMKRAMEQQDLVRETESLREETKELKAMLKRAEAQLRAGVQEPEDGRDRRVHHSDRAVGGQCARHGRERRWQGSGGKPDPLPQPPRTGAAREAQLRGAAPAPDRRASSSDT